MIQMSPHAFGRICEMQVGIDEVVAAITSPALHYPSPPTHGPNRAVSVRGRVAVVHTNEGQTTVVTVLWHGASSRDDDRYAA